MRLHLRLLKKLSQCIFFFKQKTAYEIMPSLVGSEMCIRDSIIISYNFMNKPKSQNIKNFKEKVVKTFIHGYLHLLGFDHIKDKDYRRMVSEEEKIYKSVISKIN